MSRPHAPITTNAHDALAPHPSTQPIGQLQEPTMTNPNQRGLYIPSPSERVSEHVRVYEATDGAQAGMLEGRPVIILTHIGAKTGAIRKTPIMRIRPDTRTLRSPLLRPAEGAADARSYAGSTQADWLWGQWMPADARACTRPVPPLGRRARKDRDRFDRDE